MELIISSNLPDLNNNDLTLLMATTGELLDLISQYLGSLYPMATSLPFLLPSPLCRAHALLATSLKGPMRSNLDCRAQELTRLVAPEPRGAVGD